MASHSAQLADMDSLELPSSSRGIAAGGTFFSTAAACTTGKGLLGGARATGGTCLTGATFLGLGLLGFLLGGLGRFCINRIFLRWRRNLFLRRLLSRNFLEFY